MKRKVRFELEDRTRVFASDIRKALRSLPKIEATSTDIRQLLRSSGSIAANYIEANEAVSRKDFLYRIRICIKEAKESKLWISLINDMQRPSNTELERLENEVEELQLIFGAILRNSKR